MKKIFYFTIILALLFIPNNVFAQKARLYLFHRETCPHCKAEIEYLNSIEDKYPNLEIIKYEVENNLDNNKLLRDVKKTLGDDNSYIPYTVIGKNRIVGYSEYSKSSIEKLIEACLENDCPDIVDSVSKKGDYLTIDELNDIDKNNSSSIDDDNYKDIPLLGNVNIKKTFLPIIAIILGFIDGFNPCAMWVLIFLINILIGLKDRHKMWILGFTFLFFSGFVYFLSMIGINLVLSLTSIKIIRILISLVAIIAGVLNLKKFLFSKNVGCSVTNSKKRKKLSKKINKFINEKNILIAIFSVASLAISVNLIELSCSLGFPVVYSEILAINNIIGFKKILYILLYIVFYMMDDLIVFVVAMFTFKLTGLSNRFNKYSNLIGGIIMLILGFLLIIKPEWVMFKFN